MVGEQPAGAVQQTVGWFPASEWPAAIDRWPHLLDELPADHAVYRRTVEGRIKRIREASAVRRLSVAELDVDGLTAYWADQGHDPGSEGRAAYATALARQGQARAWPPGATAAGEHRFAQLADAIDDAFARWDRTSSPSTSCQTRSAGPSRIWWANTASLR